MSLLAVGADCGIDEQATGAVTTSTTRRRTANQRLLEHTSRGRDVRFV
jgi:hypothetical protein